MPLVIIDGIEYVPRADIPELTDTGLKAALEVLTEIQYFKQTNKAIPLAWNALNALAPELAELAADNPKAAYDRIHSPNTQER